MSAVDPRIIDLVFGAVPSPPRRRRLPAAIAAAILAHLGLVVWAIGSRPSLELWSAEIAARVHEELIHVEVVDLDAPPPPAEAAPEPEPEPAAEEAEAAEEEAAEAPQEPAPPPEAPPPRSPRAPKAAPPAEAGKVIAAEPGGPVDLSDGAFVSGEGSAYAGGVTTSSGRGKTPGGRGAAPATKPAAPPPKRPAPTKVISEDRSSPVRLRPEEWICAWPREAIDEPLDEEVVVLKVLVGGDGAVEDARLVRDPGRGFGRAALSCARGTRFEPARDRQGEAIRAWSPPIRVRFYR